MNLNYLNDLWDKSPCSVFFLVVIILVSGGEGRVMLNEKINKEILDRLDYLKTLIEGGVSVGSMCDRCTLEPDCEDIKEKYKTKECLMVRYLKAEHI